MKYYDAALFIPGAKTLAETSAIMEKLNDLAVCLDFTTIVFKEDAVYFEVEYPENVSIEQLEGTGARLDLETMSNWGIEGADSQ